MSEPVGGPGDQDRRAFLNFFGKAAIIAPPVVTMLLSTSMSSPAIAASTGGGGQDPPSFKHHHGPGGIKLDHIPPPKDYGHKH